MSDHKRTARVVHHIAEVDAKAWNACANPGGDLAFDPFLSHAFLKALEDSGCVSARSGWQPFHLLLEDTHILNASAGDTHSSKIPSGISSEDTHSSFTEKQPELVGAVPLYLKSHSQGEYVFDYAWADALQRAGGAYYPKLQSSIPFTPVTGRRLLVAASQDRVEAESQLLAGCVQVANQLDVSSLHFTFLPETQWQHLGGLGLLKRIDQQYHWHNHNYPSFDAFLADLSAKKRKNIRRERRDALQQEISVEWVTGSDLTEAHWDAFFQFYMDTGSRKWGSPYLNRRFFSLITETLAEHILLIMAKRGGRFIAGALNFIGSDTLYGRNWGCCEDHPFLHFEICYYQAIEFAIQHGLKHVEAGAQGQHKIARGYVPEPTFSAHWIRDASFRRAIEEFLEDERNYVQQDIDYLSSHTPFRHESGG